jgi:hypothetical protein
VSTSTATAVAVPTAPAVVAEGCTYVAASVPGPGGISIIGLGDGGGGYDMPDICPVQACSAGLTLDLPKRGDWALGVYDVEVATDDGTLRCHHTSAPSPAWTAPARCAHEPELSAACVGPQPMFMGPIMISGAPAHVRVTIRHDGAVLADQAMTPTYSRKRWDGWDCDPSCRSASGSITVR